MPYPGSFQPLSLSSNHGDVSPILNFLSSLPHFWLLVDCLYLPLPSVPQTQHEQITHFPPKLVSLSHFPVSFLGNVLTALLSFLCETLTETVINGHGLGKGQKTLASHHRTHTSM